MRKISLFSAGALAFTIPGPDGKSTTIEAPSGIPTGGLGTDGASLIALIITFLIIGAALLALGFIVYGGILWTSSGGDKHKIETARKTIIYAVVGLIVAFMAFFIINLTGSVFSLDLIGNMGAKSQQPIPPTP